MFLLIIIEKIATQGLSNPSAVRWLGTALDGQTDSVKKNRIRLSVVHPSAVRLSMARNGVRQPDRFSQKEQNSSVRRHPHPSAVASRWLGTVFDSQTDSFKKNRIRLFVVNPVSAGSLDGQTDSVKKKRIRLSVVTHPLSPVAGSERCSTARQIQSKRTEFVCPSSTRLRCLDIVSPAISPHEHHFLARCLPSVPPFSNAKSRGAGKDDTTFV